MHPMRPCASTSASKKSKTSSLKTPPWPISNNKSSSKTNIDDLPDVVLIEILSRLPHSKILFQCKSVCKHWSSLISGDELRSRYLWHQRHLRIRKGTLIFRDPNKKKRHFYINPELELSMFKSHNFSLRSFLPRLNHPYYIKTNDDEEPVVLGVCNDLVLCCATMSCQRYYYICNPYTKQYVEVPPSPRIHHEDVSVGFICDPYYNKQGVVNDDFRFAIVRMPLDPGEHEYSRYSDTLTYIRIEIFSSVTGKWTRSFLKSPYHDFDMDSIEKWIGGIAYNGRLYWCSVDSAHRAHRALFIGVDPYNTNNDPASYHYIYAPDEPDNYYHHSYSPEDFPYNYTQFRAYLHHAGMCPRGHLRLCYMIDDYINPPSISVWELRDDDDDKGALIWCNLTAGRVCLSPVVHERLPFHYWGHEMKKPIDVLAFDPSNEDIVYLQVFDRIVAYNIRERKFEETTMLAIPYIEDDVVRSGKTVFPFVIPSWPTPLPKLQI